MIMSTQTRSCLWAGHCEAALQRGRSGVEQLHLPQFASERVALVRGRTLSADKQQAEEEHEVR